MRLLAGTMLMAVALGEAGAAWGQCANHCGELVTTSSPFCSCEVTCGSAFPCCADVGPVCQTPAVSGVTPNPVPPGGGRITITGRNFGPWLADGGTRVRVGQALCVVAQDEWTTTFIVCDLPPGAVGSLDIDTLYGQVSVPGYLSFGDPEFFGVNPQVVPATANTIVVTGRGFGTSGASATLTSPLGVVEPLAVLSQTDSQLNLSVPEGQGTGWVLTVTLRDQPTVLPFVISRRAPVVTTVNPAHLSPEVATQLTITGRTLALPRK